MFQWDGRRLKGGGRSEDGNILKLERRLQVIKENIVSSSVVGLNVQKKSKGGK